MTSSDSDPRPFLVIGGGGFLGGHILQALLARGDIVHAFDIVKKELDPKVTFFVGDLTSAESLGKAIQESNPKCIIHTASPRPEGETRQTLERVNIDGTRNVIEQAKKHGVHCLVYTSSASVIFNGSDLSNGNETLPYCEHPLDVYTETKAKGEELVLRANEDGVGGLKTVAIRPSGIYGPGDRGMCLSGEQVILSGRSHIQIGDNTNLFDFTYVGNVVDAHLLAADKLLSPDSLADSPSRIDGQAFIITNDEPWPFWDFMHLIWKEMGHVSQRKPFILSRTIALVLAYFAEWAAWVTGKPAVFTRFRVKFMCVNRWFDIGKAKKVLGYKPRVGNAEGIKRMVEWYKEIRQG
ncbi:erg26p [Hysterangium stoloniferum]|nr:erg26p [Hysterangium stoloniferum]